MRYVRNYFTELEKSTLRQKFDEKLIGNDHDPDQQAAWPPNGNGTSLSSLTRSGAGVKQ